MSKLTAELRKLSIEDLRTKVNELRTNLVEQQRALAAHELPNPYVVNKLRRQIAIALTLLNEHQRAASSPTKHEEAA